MKSFIAENETGYNTADLNCLFETFYNCSKHSLPEMLGKEWKGFRWFFKQDELPVNLCYWEDATSTEISGPRAISTFSENWKYWRVPVPGPWYCERERSKTLRQGVRRLRILSPSKIEAVMGPLEALAHVSKGAVLPEDAGVGILFCGARYMGVGLRPPHHREGNFTRSDDASLLRFLSAFVKIQELSVSINPHRDAPKVRPQKTTEERIQRLLQLYSFGGSARAMGYKLWSIRQHSDKHFDNWCRTQSHAKGLEKLGLKVEKNESTADILRKLADEYDKKQKEKK